MSHRIKVLVTGAGGQVGSAVRELASVYPSIEFHFCSREELSITDEEALRSFFSKVKPDWCVNTAAYTLVDRAETETEQARLINASAVGLLAGICKEFGTALIHISTDYVFNGKGTQPYRETDPVDPINAYGAGKAEGERLAIESGCRLYIIRTSWVYGKQGNNFVKTMKRLMAERESIGVVNDQLGCPTNAADLADVIVKIILSHPAIPGGVYHYSNAGVTTWYGFALAIRDLIESSCEVRPIKTVDFPTPAKRPDYSVMDTSRLTEALKITSPHWRDSLEKFLKDS
jgi:dTDP-4-dehydrorhamnose reductase